MDTRRTRSVLAGALLAVALPNANAAVIFSDDFNAENGGVAVLNYAGFANWTVSNGTVDLIGNGAFDFLPGNGLYIDMDGSTGSAGRMTSTSIALGPGTYELSFALAGNQRNGAQESVTVEVDAGALFSEVFSLGQSVPFTNFTRSFTVAAATSVNLSFEATGGDNAGMLLDNVVLRDVRSVPEPTTLALLGLGLAGLGALKRRPKRASRLSQP